MAIVEKVRQIIGSSSNKDLLNPSIKLVENIESSQVLEVLKDISSQLPEIKISENVIEDGRKMVVTVDWEKSENNANNYFIVSITEPAISFIGNTKTDNYHRLEGVDIANRQLVEDSILGMFKDPCKK